MAKYIGCRMMEPTGEQLEAARKAARERYPHRYGEVTPASLTADIKRWWGDKGHRFTVGFFGGPSQATRSLILAHLNAWSEFANVEFVHSKVDQEVRIAFERDGYWSYVGTDILGIPKSQPTMNLEGITANTPDREVRRVVRHEGGHTLGFEHEHMRREIVSRISVPKALSYFWQTQRWSPAVVQAQVLTPLDEKSIRGTPTADDVSIMCYDLPGEIMIDGRDVPGGDDINPTDASFIASIYPKAAPPVVPPGADPAAGITVLVGDKKYRLVPV